MRNHIIEQDLDFIVSANLPWEDLSHKTVLISGAAGFLPSYMVETLAFLNQTKYLNIRIIALVRHISKANARFAHLLGKSYLQLLEQDVCTPLHIDEPIDYIIHAASFATPKMFDNDPVATILPNVIGTKNLLELAVQKNISTFLFFSTSGVYGFVPDQNYPIKEDDFGALNPMHPSSCYLESKRMGENMCSCWHKQHNVPVKIVRPAITYGPGLDLKGGRSFEDFTSCIVENRDIILHSDGNAIRNFCYIADATLGFFSVLLKGKNGEAYNIATDHEISIKDLAQELVTNIFPERNLQVLFKYDQSKQAIRTNFSRTTVDISKAKSLGWTLSFPIKEGFKRVVASFEKKTQSGKDVQ